MYLSAPRMFPAPTKVRRIAGREWLGNCLPIVLYKMQGQKQKHSRRSLHLSFLETKHDKYNKAHTASMFIFYVHKIYRKHKTIWESEELRQRNTINDRVKATRLVVEVPSMKSTMADWLTSAARHKLRNFWMPIWRSELHSFFLRGPLSLPHTTKCSNITCFHEQTEGVMLRSAHQWTRLRHASCVT